MAIKCYFISVSQIIRELIGDEDWNAVHKNTAEILASHFLTAVATRYKFHLYLWAFSFRPAVIENRNRQKSYIFIYADCKFVFSNWTSLPEIDP